MKEPRGAQGEMLDNAHDKGIKALGQILYIISFKNYDIYILSSGLRSLFSKLLNCPGVIPVTFLNWLLR